MAQIASLMRFKEDRTMDTDPKQCAADLRWLENSRLFDELESSQNGFLRRHGVEALHDVLHHGNPLGWEPHPSLSSHHKYCAKTGEFKRGLNVTYAAAIRAIVVHLKAALVEKEVRSR